MIGRLRREQLIAVCVGVPVERLRDDHPNEAEERHQRDHAAEGDRQHAAHGSAPRLSDVRRRLSTRCHGSGARRAQVRDRVSRAWIRVMSSRGLNGFVT